MFCLSVALLNAAVVGKIKNPNRKDVTDNRDLIRVMCIRGLDLVLSIKNSVCAFTCSAHLNPRSVGQCDQLSLLSAPCIRLTACLYGYQTTFTCLLLCF